jgi:hypothetical protein
MDWQQGNSKEKLIQFIPAEKGWLALFEETTSEGTQIHADPVIAWCLGAQDLDDGHHIVSFGQAVIGASPWLEKADTEQSTHFFALVREEQLDRDFLDELKIFSRHSREDILIQAKENQALRHQGHASWRRKRRGERGDKSTISPLRLFSMSS